MFNPNTRSMIDPKGELLDLSSVSELHARQTEALVAKHGEQAQLAFPTPSAATAAVAALGLKGWTGYGLRRNNVSWYQLRPDNPEGVKRPGGHHKPEGAPTAKSICLSLWTESITRDAFVAAAAAQGVKEITAKTLYSDIKSGRITPNV